MKLKALAVNVMNKVYKGDQESSLAVELNSESLEKHKVLSESFDEALKVSSCVIKNESK